MKNFVKGFLMILLFSGIIPVINSCKDGSEPTKATVPKLTTKEVTNINQGSANSGGIITDDGGSSVTACGVCWSTENFPYVSDHRTNEDADDEDFVSTLSGLEHNTIYHVRAYATNVAGTGYGNEVIFYVGPLEDIEGNVYQVVQFGSQFWMGENLKTTKYNNNTSIQNVTNNTEWSSLTSGAYSWYNNSIANMNIYGALYNWYAVNTGLLCPDGWHVATNSDFTILVNYAGGASIAGGRLKEVGITHWTDPNTQGTDNYHFTALPAGYREPNGVFDMIGYDGGWWTSNASTTDVNSAWLWDIFVLSHPQIQNYEYNKKLGYSVRCVRE